MSDLLEANWLSACSVEWLRVVLDATCKGLVILAAAGALSLALRRSSAAARHLVWVLAIGALISLPVLSAVLPGWQVPHLPRWEIAGEAPVESAPVAADGRAADRGGFNVGPPLTGAAGPERTHPAEAAPAPGAMAQAETIEETVPIAAVETPGDTQAARPLHWSAWVLLAWAAGALAVLVPLLVGTVKVWRLARRAGSISDGSWERLLARLSAGLGLRRAVRLLRSDRPVVPASWGLWRPVVLLPACADDWPAGRRRVVLVHELAHVKRRDCLTQLLAQIACAAYWFNPLAWLAARMLRLERERACDDLVLAAGSRPSDYAGHLLEIVRSVRLLAAPSLAAVSMGRRFGFEGRLRAILDAGRNRRTLTRLAVIVALAAVTCVVVPLAAVRPEEQTKAAPAAKAEADPATQPGESPREVAGAFLRALASGQDEKAKGMTRPDTVKPEDFPKFREWSDLSEVRIEQLLISKQDACVVTSALPGRKGARTMHMGLGLRKHEDRWLVRDVDALPNKKAVRAFVEGFKKAFPDFKMETPPTPPATQAAEDAQAKRIGSLIEQLGAKAFAARRDAQRELVAIGLPALGPLRQVQAEEDPERAARAASVAEEIIDAAFRAQVGKVTIHLLGVSDKPTSPEGWWLPNGQPMDKPPAGARDETGSERDRLFAIEVRGLERGAQLHVKIEPSQGGGYTNVSRRAGESRGFYGRSIPPGVGRVVVDVGIEQGPWQRFAEASPGQTTRDQTGGEVTVSRVRKENEKLEATCTYQTEDGWRYRMVLIKNDGSAAYSSGSDTYVERNVRRMTAPFKNLQPAAVARVRLERRGVKWVRFGNVSVLRGRITDFGPAKMIPATLAGRAPPPAGVAPAEAASLDEDEAQAAAVAERFLRALHASRFDDAKALSVGAVVGWLSDKQLSQWSGERPVGLMANGALRVAREIQKEVQYPRGKPRAGRPAIRGDFAGVPFQTVSDSQYLLVLLKRTTRGWRFVTLDEAKGGVGAETTEKAQRIRKGLAAVGHDLRDANGLGGEDSPPTPPATQTREAIKLRSFNVTPGGVSVIRYRYDQRKLSTGWTGPPRGEVEFKEFALRVGFGGPASREGATGQLVQADGSAIPVARLDLRGQDDLAWVIRQLARGDKDGGRDWVAVFLGSTNIGTIEQAWDALCRTYGERAVLLVRGKLPREHRLLAIAQARVPAAIQPATIRQGSSQTQPAPRKAYIPDADTKGAKVVLDLASGEMLAAGKDDQFGHFGKLGKGDLAYDRALICLRGATPRMQKPGKVMDLKVVEKRGDATAYELPGSGSRLLVTVAGGRQFEVELVSRGIRMEYDQPLRGPMKGHVGREVHVHDADTKGVKAVLHLASGEMLPVGKDDQFGHFTKLGKGDLAYDRALICLRGATAKTATGKALKILQKRGDMTAYEIPQVPLGLVVSTADGRGYRISVLSRGILVRYKKLLTPPATQARADGPRERAKGFLAAIAAGEVDKALTYTTETYARDHRREVVGLVRNADLSAAKVAHVEQADADAAVVFAPITPKAGGRSGGPMSLGVGLRRVGQAWRIRDLDALPHKQAVKEYLESFRRAFPSATTAAIENVH